MTSINRFARSNVPLTYEDGCILAKGYYGSPVLPGTPVRDPLWSGTLWGMAVFSAVFDAELMRKARDYRSSRGFHGPIVYGVKMNRMARYVRGEHILFGGQWQP